MLTFGRRVTFEGRDGYLVAIVDITERRKAEARIAHMAHHDGLTNLPNREFYQERLDQALERGQPGNKRVRCCASISTCSRTSMIHSAIRWATAC